MYSYIHTHIMPNHTYLHPHIHIYIHKIQTYNSKRFQTTSNQVLCTLTCITPVVFKAEEAAMLWNLMRKSQDHNLDF